MQNIKRSRESATMKAHEIEDVSGFLCGGYAGYDDSWDIEKFKKQIQMQVVMMADSEMEFDIIGMDASLVNAFRRILIAEVPSMAIEKVHMFNNTSVIPDEVLAHRLGLIPLKADARHFKMVTDEDEKDPEVLAVTTLDFDLKIKCTWDPKHSTESTSIPIPTDAEKSYVNHLVDSNHLRWVPVGSQASYFKASDVGPSVDKIVIAKLRPGHELNMRLKAVKGVGKDHAKFSPVGTAFYRLLPQITLLKEVSGEAAERLQKCFSPGVIQLVESKGKKVAKVKNARYDSCSRNVLRYDDLADCVELGRVKDHHIFSIEATGSVLPNELFVQAIRILKYKCNIFLEELEQGLDE